MKRKLLAVLLVVCMIFSTVPVFANSISNNMNSTPKIPELIESETLKKDPEDNLVSLEEENLELSDVNLNPPVLANESPGMREEIHIRTKDELVRLLNTVYYQTASGNNNYRYGVENTDIYLEGDFIISSDDINGRINSNPEVELRHNSFYMTNSSFYGQGHTITIEKGTRDMYSLFGDLSTNNQSVYTIKDLNIVYNGDVVGSGFARNITSHDNMDSHIIENVNITVNGNILPFVMETLPKRKIAMSSGFSFGIVSTRVDKVKINVSGNIGLENPVTDTSGLDFVYSRSAGFMLDRVQRFSSQNNFRDITNLDIKVGGSILAGSTGYYAEADGLGHDIQAKNFKNIKLHVGGDIKAVVNGDYKAPFTLYKSSPITASAVGYNLHHLENLDINIGGSVMAINNGDLNTHTMAMGIGRYDYESDLSDVELQSYPLTIKNVNLNVGGNISATANKDYRENDKKVSTFACAGFMNDMDSGLENYDVFEGNTINVSGNVESNNKAGFSNAWLWGYFMGDRNSLSANSLIAKNGSGPVHAAPFRAFVKGQNNTVKLNSDIIAKGVGGEVGGFAEDVTRFDGIADGNIIDIKGFDLKGIEKFGGFAVYTDKHKNQPKIDIDVKNVDLHLGDVKIESPQEIALIGGFIAHNGSGKELNNNKVTLGDLTVNGSGYVGGFVGYNSGKINNSFANVKSINVLGNQDKQDANNHCVGGFAGYGYGGSINNSGAFVEDSIKTTNGNNANVGGFAGCIYDQTFSNNAAQVGENIISTNNKGAANIGGFAGLLANFHDKVTVDKSTSLVFGNISGESDSTEDSGVAAGFVGALFNKDNTLGITDSASYVGGKLEIGGKNPEKDFATAVGVLYKARLKGFTVLGNITDKADNNKLIVDKYVAAMEDGIFENNFVTEVKDGNRKAFSVTKSGDKFAKGSELGQIDIGGRAFQDKYWAKDLNSANSGKENFVYVEKNDKNIVFTPIATGLGTISTSPFKKATLPDFYTRHLALLSNDGPIYDILGIPAGKAEEPKPEPKPEPEPKPNPEDPKPVPKPEEPKGGLHFNLSTKHELNLEDHYQYLLGYKDDTFRPENNMTREEVAVMFSRLLKNRPIKGKVYSYDFSDVENNRWSVTAISYMNELGIIKGYPDGTFRPENGITRAEFAAIATRFANLNEGVKTFTDLGPEHWAYEAVGKAASAGWITGYPDDSFRPEQEIKRSEVVTLVNRMLNRYGDEEYIVKNKDKILYFTDIDKHWAYYAIVEATNGHDFERANNGKDEIWKDLNKKTFVYDK